MNPFPASVPRLLRILDRSVAAAPARVVTHRFVLAALRAMSALTLPWIRKDRVSVVIVNWNTLGFLRETLAALGRFSKAPLEVIVVDNGSRDGSVEFLRGAFDLRSVRLKRNVGHSTALDLGFLLASSEIVLSLDVDAFPIREGWIETVVSPLHADATVSGVQLWRPYAHPCCMAMRKRRFVLRRHTFRARYASDRERLGRTAWDVGESISMREARSGGLVNLIPLTTQRGPGDVGTVFGDCVYHNFYSARHQEGPALLDGVSADDSARAWQEAVERYLRN